MSKYCAHCGELLRDDDVFCGKCGTRQETEAAPTPDAVGKGNSCIKCGSKLEDGALFCNVCGARQEAAIPIVETPAEAPVEPEPIQEKRESGRRCIQCGQVLDNGEKFCIHCGTRQDLPDARAAADARPNADEPDIPEEAETHAKKAPPAQEVRPRAKRKRRKKTLLFVIGGIVLAALIAAFVIFFLNAKKNAGLMELDEVEQQLNAAFSKVWGDFDVTFDGIEDFKITNAEDGTGEQRFSGFVIPSEDGVSGLRVMGSAKDGKVIQIQSIFAAFPSEEAINQLSPDTLDFLVTWITYPVSIFKEDIDTEDELRDFLSNMDVVSDGSDGPEKMRTVDGDIEYTYMGGAGNNTLLTVFTIRYLPAFETGFFEDDGGDDVEKDISAYKQNTPLQTDRDALYADKIAEYEQALAMGVEAFEEKYDGSSDCSSINALMLSYSYRYGGVIGYTIVDVDGNGVEELIFSDLRSIIDIYTVRDGAVIKLFEDCGFGDRSRLHVRKDGTLLSEGSSGASSASCELYRIDDPEETLSLMDAYYCDENGPSSYMTGKYVSGEEYPSILNAWMEDTVFDTFSWTVIAVKQKPAPEEIHTHSFGSWTDDKNASTHSRACSCGEKESEAHAWRKPGKVTKEATATSTGIMTYTCTKCTAAKTETIPQLQQAPHTHVYGAWTDNKDGSTHIRSCSCGERESAPHSWDPGKVTKEATTTAAGVFTYTCTKCGAEKTESIPKIEPHTHSYGNWEDDENGSTHSKVCSCGDMQTKPHSFDSGRVTKEATVSSTGVRTYTCTACGAEKTESIPKLDDHAHSYGSWQDDENDSTHSRACSCGDVQTESHAWNSGKVTKEATSSSTGVMTYTCRKCGASYTETIPQKEQTVYTYCCYTAEFIGKDGNPGRIFSGSRENLLAVVEYYGDTLTSDIEYHEITTSDYKGDSFKHTDGITYYLAN